MSAPTDYIFHDESISTCPITGETRQEELINYWTHFIGFLLSLVAGPLLLWNALSSDLLSCLGCSAYVITLITLYGASAYYHRCRLLKRKKMLRIVDHSCIYFFIAGSYTPFTLGPLRDHNGWIIFLIVWSIALFGITFKVIAIDRFKALSLFSYLFMGWLIVFNFPILIEQLSTHDLTWMVLGGLSYTTGTIFYVWESLPYSHAIWHLFVLGGSICHYCAIYDLLQI